MKLVRFELQCAREVPFYAHLCNRYLQYTSLKISIVYHNSCYIIEAEGNQTALEQLSEQIAADFLMSVWLTGSKIRVVDSRIGSHKPISLGNAPIQDYCQQCFSAFGDNQSPEFGNILHICPICHGEQHWQKLDTNDINQAAIKALAEAVLTGKTVTLADNTKIQLNQPFSQCQGLADLLVCNPNTLNQFFSLDREQVLALSAIEKPFIRAQVKSSNSFNDQRLTDKSYRLCFSYQRQLIVLAEMLRQRGVNFVFISSVNHRPEFTRIFNAHQDTRWVEITAPHPLTLTQAPEPLHDDAYIENWQANWHKQQLNLIQTDNVINVSSDLMAKSALLGALLDSAICNTENNKPLPFKANKTAALYFSAQYNGKLVYTDNEANIQTFLTLPSLPQSGEQILAALQTGKQAAITAKFAEKFPQTLTCLNAVKFNTEAKISENVSCASLTTLHACIAILLGFADKDPKHISEKSPHELALALQACAQSQHKANAPRIDFPLVTLTDNKGLSIDWVRTLGSIMAFRLADPDSLSYIAFGVHDSMADYFANWIEHLDQQWGIDRVALCGDEMANELLARRLSLRIGKNFELLTNHHLPLDGANCAAGALYLKQRRHR